MGEGFDEPRLDTLFVTMPIAWKGTVAQYAGRFHRIYEGKQEVAVYDYVDVHIPVLERMYYKRLAAYASLGYSVQTLAASEPKPGVIFNQQSFLPVLTCDIEQAKNEIFIVSPYLSKVRINQMKQLLLAVANGTSIAVFTHPPESYAKASQQKITDMIDDLIQNCIKGILSIP